MKKALVLFALVSLFAGSALADTTRWSCTWTKQGSSHADGPDYLNKKAYELEIHGTSLTLSQGRRRLAAHASNSNPFGFFVDRDHNDFFSMDELNSAIIDVAARMIRQHDSWNARAEQSFTLSINPTDDAGSKSKFMCSALN
jgi:hypothetical protein